MRIPPLRTALALLLTVLHPSPDTLAADSQYLFRHYTTDDGLAGNSILCMTQDKMGILWAGTRNGVCWFDGERFNAPAVQDADGFLSGSINSICIAADGQVWMSTARGLCSYDPATGELRTLGEEYSGARDLQCDAGGRIWCILDGEIRMIDPKSGEAHRYASQDSFYPYRCCPDSKGQMWFASRDGQLYRYLPESDSFEQYRILPRQTLAEGIYPRLFIPLSDGDFLIATSNNEVWQTHPARGSSERLMTAGQMEDEALVMCLLENRKGEYLVGSNKGLYLLDSGTRSVSEIGSDPIDRLSLSTDNIRTLFRDRDGQVWIGTFYSGLNLWQQSEFTFYRNFSDSSPLSIRGNTVRSICQDDAERIWIGTEDGFLNRIGPDGTVLPIGAEHGLPPMANYHSLLLHGSQLVIATYDNGLFLFDPDRLRVTAHYGIPGESFICLMETRDGQLLTGTGSGVYSFSPESGQFERLEALGTHFVHALCEDRQGRIWIGTLGAGPWILDREAGTCTPMVAAPGSIPLERTRVTHLAEDRNGVIWMATEGNGLCRAEADPRDPHRFLTAQFTLADGLPSNVTCAIVQGREGLLWVSTDKGLFSFDPEGNRLTDSYYDKNGTVGNYFRYGSVMTDQTGRIYLGTTLGMMAFRPSVLRERREPVLLLTDILAGSADQTLRLHEPGRSALTSSRITVRRRDAAYLTFRFANITSDDWHHQRYRYGFSRRRNKIESVTEENSVTFAGIREGRYNFYVSVDGADSPQARRELTIRVRPPLTASLPARILYLLALLAAGFWMFHNYGKRKKLEREQYLQRLEDEKQHEIYDAKINFFTNIAHEIRTPLTLIKMPVDKILEEQRFSEDNREDIVTVKANTDRLLSLTNQLLDFRKMESKQMKLNFLQEDLCALTRRVCGYFTRAAQEHHIDFSTHIPDGEIPVMCAAASVEKIISNLISNGLKYCQNQVTLSLAESADGKGAILRVTSDGQAIAPADRERIFEPFYQERMTQIKIIGSKGTGLGLPFARMLTELHNGRLYLEDTGGPGNCFVLELPKEQDQPIGLHLQPTDVPEPDPAVDDGMERNVSGRHTVLIAEDDLELNNYLKKELSAEYNVLQATNGDDALEMVKTQKVDILVSDIMMPGIDGCALCNIIKTSLEYSHIPVLLLTAAVGMERHIETLQVGADGYLEKPFPISLLKANIQNLFDNRELTFKQFTSSPLSHFNGLKVGNMDDDYMNRLHKEVMKRLSDPDLSIDELVSTLGTSKSTLFRKVKANTGLNIAEYIKLCRLKKAAELLAGQKYKIGEVVYLVGFSSASYFTASFKKQFNVSPSDFVRQVRGGSKSGGTGMQV